MANAPRITIDETDVGQRPVVDVQYNQIGVVGMTNFGPVNVPTFVSSLAEFREKFGSTYEVGLTGHLTMEQIYAQNALAGVWFVRLAPTSSAGVKATKALTGAAAADSMLATALEVGTDYNNVTVQVSAGTSSGVKLTVVHTPTGITEVFDNQNVASSANTLASAGGPNEPGAGSKFVSITKVGGATVNPSVAAAANLTSGTNGTAQASDYIGASGSPGTGMYALDSIPTVRYLVLAQQTTATVGSGMSTYVEARSAEDGLVVGIVSAPDSADPSSVTHSLDTDRLFVTYPFFVVTSAPVAERNNYVAIAGAVAGVMSKNRAHVSPSNQEVLGLVKPRYALNRTQVDLVANKRINPVTAVRNRGFRIRSGYTAATDTAWALWEVRGEYDRLEQLSFDAMAIYESAPNDDNLRTAVSTQLDAILRHEKDTHAIAEFQPTICDATNNTPTSIDAGNLVANERFRPLVGAHFINLKVSRITG